MIRWMLVGLLWTTSLGAQSIENPKELVGTWRVVHEEGDTLQVVFQADGTVIQKGISGHWVGRDRTGEWWVEPRASTTAFPKLCEDFGPAFVFRCDDYEWLEQDKKLRVNSVVFVKQPD